MPRNYSQEKIDEEILNIILRSTVRNDNKENKDIQFLMQYIRELQDLNLRIELKSKSDTIKNIAESIKIIRDKEMLKDENELNCFCYNNVLDFIKEEFGIDTN